MQDHAFFIALAYGVSLVALGVELVCVYARSRRLRNEAEPRLATKESR
ncbi:MAG: heme exporter protein CcmD [Comamonas sp.]|jgi:heme exporter protein D|nr:heme exporter protein CcmD [Comamonas sp.]MDR3066251.1 heme exporter protein CcmD [Comamonas sp.]